MFSALPKLEKSRNFVKYSPDSLLNAKSKKMGLYDDSIWQNFIGKGTDNCNYL